MALRIIVDGYNLLMSSEQWEHPQLETARKKLLAGLNRYYQVKKNPITVVFDAWQKGLPLEQREKVGNLEVIFSQRGEKADEVIKRFIDHNQGRNTVIVTSDREIVTYANIRGIVAISSREFEKKLIETTKQPPEEEPIPSRLPGTRKKGTAYRLSRRKRQQQAVLKKL